MADITILRTLDRNLLQIRLDASTGNSAKKLEAIAVSRKLRTLTENMSIVLRKYYPSGGRKTRKTRKPRKTRHLRNVRKTKRKVFKKLTKKKKKKNLRRTYKV